MISHILIMYGGDVYVENSRAELINHILIIYVGDVYVENSKGRVD